MKYKWVIMQELEDSHGAANPCKIVDTEERAEELCSQLEHENPGFIFWTFLCEEE